MKVDITSQQTNEGMFRTHESFSPAEILAAGGTTAFALKLGKSHEKLVQALKDGPAIEPFSDEEWADLLHQLEITK